MRILKLSYEFSPLGGGGSKVVYGLSKELVLSGHEVDLVTMGYKGLPRYEEIDGVNVYRVRCVRMRESVCSTPEMLSYALSALPILFRLVGGLLEARGFYLPGETKSTVREKISL